MATSTHCPPTFGSSTSSALPLPDHLLERVRHVDRERHARIALQVLPPHRALARNDPQRAVAPLVPARHHVRVAVRVEAGESHHDATLEERVTFLLAHAADLASPLLRCLAHLGTSWSGTTTARPAMRPAQVVERVVDGPRRVRLKRAVNRPALASATTSWRSRTVPATTVVTDASGASRKKSNGSVPARETEQGDDPAGSDDVGGQSERVVRPTKSTTASAPPASSRTAAAASGPASTA